MKARKGKGLFVFCCLAPAAILFIVFMILPTIDIFRMSMFKWGGYTDNKTFVGLDNFKILFKSDKFYQAFQNSILLIVLVTLVTFTFALVFAYILSREKIKGKTFFSVIFYIPNILSVVVISAIFSAIYDPNLGLLNSFLNLFFNIFMMQIIKIQAYTIFFSHCPLHLFSINFDSISVNFVIASVHSFQLSFSPSHSSVQA